MTPVLSELMESMELVIHDRDTRRTIRIPFENVPLLIAAIPMLEKRFGLNGEDLNEQINNERLNKQIPDGLGLHSDRAESDGSDGEQRTQQHELAGRSGTERPA